MEMMVRLKEALGQGHENLVAEMETAMTTFGEMQTAHATLMAERDEMAARHEAMQAERDSLVAERDRVVAEAQAASEVANDRWSTAMSREAELTQRYLGAVRAANADLPEELVVGDTMEAIDAAIASAKAIVAKVQERLTAELAARTVPNGAPARGGVDMENMSPKEKIAMGLRRG